VKRMLCVYVAVVVLSAFSGSALALTFTNVVDWNLMGPWQGEYYRVVLDASWNPDFSYLHVLDLDPPGLTIESATLSLRHVGNVSDLWNPEIWFATTGGGIQIGQLSKSRWISGWTTDTWSLSENILSEMTSTSPWSLEVRLSDPTSLPDGLRIDKSVLSGSYTPVPSAPEPNSFVLLGAGLLGLGVYSRFRKKKRWG